jgi:ribosome-binding factor A
MSSRRTQKAAEAIREVVSMAILTELKDPRVRDVTVTHVEVTPDMRQAKVYVSIMGDEKQQKLTLHGLENSAGFLQSKVAKRIDTRYTPRLAFVLDLGVKRSLEIAQIMQQVLPKHPTPDPTALADPTSLNDDTRQTEDAGDEGAHEPDHTSQARDANDAGP